MAGESLERKVLGDFKRSSALLGFSVTAKDSVMISKGRGWVNHPTPFPQQPGPKPVLSPPLHSPSLFLPRAMKSMMNDDTLTQS